MQIYEAMQILGLSPSSSLQDAKRNYRVLCRKCHPDVGGDVESFNKVNKAWDLVKGGLVSTSHRSKITHVSLFSFK